MVTNNITDMIIGIDPDIDKSGLAIIQNGSYTQLTTLSIFDLVEFLRCNKIQKVYIEAGWLINKSNWHKAQGLYRREKIAKNVGENHAVGKVIEIFCKGLNLNYELIKPKGKIKADIFNKIVGWDGRTNQEERDAAMLIVKYLKK